MDFPYYAGEKKTAPNEPLPLPVSPYQRHVRPEGYIAEPGLVDAVNTALLLNEPLLLTGQPGSGKTQLAYSLAWQIGCGTPLRFQAKSTSKSADLFYTFDALARFHRTSDGQADALPYVRYQALGLAIMLANEPDEVASLLPANFVHTGRTRSVVLIDEVDKAPRDFPNDVLGELEEMQFQISELDGQRVSADSEWKPVVVITSNSERQLPEAFLRRCVYYDIPFPTSEQLTAIIRSRLGDSFEVVQPFLEQALQLFETLHSESTELVKPPSTAELISWLTVLRELTRNGANPWTQRDRLFGLTNSVLLKTREDQSKAKPLIDAWLRSVEE